MGAFQGMLNQRLRFKLAANAISFWLRFDSGLLVNSCIAGKTGRPANIFATLLLVGRCLTFCLLEGCLAFSSFLAFIAGASLHFVACSIRGFRLKLAANAISLWLRFDLGLLYIQLGLKQSTYCHSVV